MKVLLVLAHPLSDSLCAHLARRAEAALIVAGYEVEMLDLYGASFTPALTAAERAGYGARVPTPELVSFHAQLRRAEALVLVFPTWWGALPAMLKGWFDRVWSPGVAFDHGTPIKPLLQLRSCIAITTLGSPWWFDWLIMRRPLARTLRHGVLLACAPRAKFRLLSLYGAEGIAADRLSKFESKLGRALRAI